MLENPLNCFDADWEEKIRVHFAGHIQSQISGHNSIVTGFVVANAPFGIFVDIGCGIPFLLDDIYIGHEEGQNMTPHWTKPLGAKICAKIGDESGKFPRLHQWDYEQWGPQRLSSDELRSKQ